MKPTLNESQAHAGAIYDFELIRGGRVIDRWSQHNKIPIEGLNYLTGAAIKGATQISTWFIGLFEGNYTPADSDTASTFPTVASECISYLPATRPPFTAGAVANGIADNTAARAEFTFTADKTIYGAFLMPSSAKGAQVGPLLSAARLANPRAVQTDDILRITCSFEIASKE